MKKLFTIFMAVLVLCTCATADMSAKKRTSRRTSNSSSTVNLFSDYPGNQGIFHYQEVLNGGRQIHDYILAISVCDYGCTPNCDAYYYDVYNDNVIYMQGYTTSKNNTLELMSDNLKLTVTYLSKTKIKVKEGNYTSTFKKISDVNVNTILDENSVKNAVDKLPY